MSSKKNEDNTEKSAEQKDKMAALQEKITRLEEEKTQLKKELEERQDKLLRAYADLQNYRRRMEKELSDCENETKKKYLEKLVDFREYLRQAAEDNNPKEGIRSVRQDLDQFLEKEDIQYIDCIGKPFDHSLHHAVTTVEQNDCREDVVVDEVKKGYKIGGTLLRPSHVIVAKPSNTKNKEE